MMVFPGPDEQFEPEPFEPDEVDTLEPPPAVTPPASTRELVMQLVKRVSDLQSLYEQYEDIHRLAKKLNGLPTADPLPVDINVAGVFLKYQLGDTNYSANLLPPKYVGEIAELLHANVTQIVDELVFHAAAIRSFAAGLEQRCAQAKFNTRLSDSKNIPT
jgi:hypothetical protein